MRPHTVAPLLRPFGFSILKYVLSPLSENLVRGKLAMVHDVVSMKCLIVIILVCQCISDNLPQIMMFCSRTARFSLEGFDLMRPRMRYGGSAYGDSE